MMVNAYSSPLEFTVQVPGTWRLLLDTSAHQPPQLAATGPGVPEGPMEVPARPTRRALRR